MRDGYTGPDNAVDDYLGNKKWSPTTLLPFRLADLYLNPAGQLSRVDFWRLFVLPGALIAVPLMVLFLNSLPERAFHDPVLLANGLEHFAGQWSIVLTLLVWTGLCGGFKRLRDRGHYGCLYLAPAALILAMHLVIERIPVVGVPLEIGTNVIPLTFLVISGGAVAINFWLIVNLYFLPGTKGANKQALDPLEINYADAHSDACPLTYDGGRHPRQMERERRRHGHVR